jgi:hypothetical protein
MQVVDEMGFRQGINGICVTVPYGHQCTRGCADLSCICGEWLLPPGWYVNPFDNSGMSFFQCGSDGKQADIRVCQRGYVAVHGRGCVLRSSAQITCANRVMKGYGFCDVSFIGGPSTDSLLSTGRRLSEAGNTTEAAHAGVAALAAGAAGVSNQTGWEPTHNAGRGLKNFWVNNGPGYLTGKTTDWRQCYWYDINAAERLGCFNRWLSPPQPPRQLRYFAGYPHAYQCRAGAVTYNQRNPGAGCFCEFRYACPNYVSTNCKDHLVRNTVR